MAGPTGNETNHVLDGLTVRGGFAIEGVGGTKTYLNSDVVSYLARQQVATKATGVLAETIPFSSVSASATGATGGVFFGLIGLLAGDVVTNIQFGLQTIGVTVSLARCGVYSRTGTLLAQTADIAATMNGTTGRKTVALSTPYSVTTDDAYYLATISVSAGTMPALVCGLAGSVVALAGTGGIISFGVQTGQSDLPASATIGTSSIRPNWLAAT